MRVRGKLNLAVERARDIHALMRDGGVDGLSIGFRVERARAERPTGLRRLEKLDLWEISIVTFPMLPGCAGRDRQARGSAAGGDDPPHRRAIVRLNPAVAASALFETAGGVRTSRMERVRRPRVGRSVMKNFAFVALVGLAARGLHHHPGARRRRGGWRRRRRGRRAGRRRGGWRVSVL